jgi:hypothetical protein
MTGRIRQLPAKITCGRCDSVLSARRPIGLRFFRTAKSFTRRVLGTLTRRNVGLVTGNMAASRVSFQLHAHSEQQAFDDVKSFRGSRHKSSRKQ